MTPSVYDFIPVIEAERGKRYVFGAETRFTDPSPPAFDCSELVQWGLARVGVANPPDGARNQFEWCKGAHLLLPIQQGIATFGALLFRLPPNHEDHVAVSLGNGHTFEARGRKYGVNEFTAYNRAWTSTALIPGLSYAHRPLPVLRPGDDMLNDVEHRMLQEVRDALYTGKDKDNHERGPIGGLVARLDERVATQGRDLGAIKAKLGIGS